MRASTLITFPAIATLATWAFPHIFQAHNEHHRSLSGLHQFQARDDSLQPFSGPAILVHTKSFKAQTADSAIDTINWAGAVITSPPNNTRFTSVGGRFTIPSPLLPLPEVPKTTYTAGIWIGLDGLTYQSAILQAGVRVTVTLNATSFQPIYEFRAFTEWYPSPAVFFNSSQLAVNAGDILDISISSQSPFSGTVILSNLSTNQNVTRMLSAPSPASTLKGMNAEWIVEDPRNSATTELPFPNFEPITFDACVAGTADGRKVGSSSATEVELFNTTSNRVLTSVTMPGEGVVVVTKLDI